MKEERKIGPTVLVTAGPTRAYLDPVRFISNYSTGRVGFQICQALIKRQFSVIAIVGNSSLDFESLGLKKLLRVETNREMLKWVLKVGRDYQPKAAIFSAAVLDFVPKTRQKNKVSSSIPSWKLDLVPAPKIIDEFVHRFPSTKVVEFKLESKPFNAKGLAQSLLKRRNSIAVCLNRWSGIKGNSHRAYLYPRSGKPSQLFTKTEIGRKISDLVAVALQNP